MNTWKDHACPNCGTISSWCWSDLERKFPKQLTCPDCGGQFIRTFPLIPTFAEYLANNAPELLTKLEEESDLLEVKS